MKIYVCLVRVPPETEPRGCLSWTRIDLENHKHRVSEIETIEFRERIISLPNDRAFKESIRAIAARHGNRKD